jgi:hypothetical protein
MDILLGVLLAFGGSLIGLIGLVASIFWIWMLVDALLYEPTPMEKLLWFLVIFFLYLIGALIYFFVRRRQRRW